MLVEVDLFSGRPNPRWELDDEARRELLQLEAALAPAERPATEPPGLGYRGFRYEENGETRRAFLGSVEKGGKVLADPSRAIERFLLAHLPAEFAPLREAIETEMTRP